MLELIEQAAGKEAERENKKLAKRVRLNAIHFSVPLKCLHIAASCQSNGREGSTKGAKERRQERAIGNK